MKVRQLGLTASAMLRHLPVHPRTMHEQKAYFFSVAKIHNFLHFTSVFYFAQSKLMNLRAGAYDHRSVNHGKNKKDSFTFEILLMMFCHVWSSLMQGLGALSFRSDIGFVINGAMCC